MDEDTLLYSQLAAAFVRGKLHSIPGGDPTLFDTPLELLTEAQCDALLQLGRSHELRLHRFKRTMGLPRVTTVLGMLKGMQPTEVLDIGSGRGAFLWLLLDTFAWLPITALDVLDYRITDIEAVRDGGISTLTPVHGDATHLPFDDGQFDGVTMLEVLEHIPDTAAALKEVCRVARRFVVLSVPSKADDNPEHIHLFTAGQLESLLRQVGVDRVHVTYVPGHLVALARITR